MPVETGPFLGQQCVVDEYGLGHILELNSDGNGPGSSPGNTYVSCADGVSRVVPSTDVKLVRITTDGTAANP